MMTATPVALPVGSSKLTGTLIGTAGSYQSKGNTIANAVDGNTGTFFDAPSGVQGWVGLSLPAASLITQVQFVPRSGFASRMVGGIFQGSTTPDFSAGVTNLYTIPFAPVSSAYTAVQINSVIPFQYVRYLAPVTGSGNVAEVEFDGTPAGPIPPPPPLPPLPPPPPPPLPLTPATVLATAGTSTSVQLTWQEDPASIVSSFTIERQGPTDADFVTIATAAAGATSFVDPNVLSNTAYSYEIIANNAGGSSAASASASVTTPPPPINPWSDSDIGAVGFAGSASVNPNGSITVTGGGADIWNQTDAFNFESQSLIGNGNLIAQVNAQTNSNAWAKSGVMMRETADADSRYVLLALTPSNGITLQARTATHMTPTVSISAPAKAGIWLELVRNGSTFSGYDSANGLNWALVGTVNIPMVNNIQAGLAVTAHNNAKISTATFSNVSVTATGSEASSWSNGAAAPLFRWESADFTYNGLMYAFGGFIDRSLDSTAECDSYNPATNTWSYVTSIPTGGLTHDAVALNGDTAYFAGGNIGAFTNYKTGVATNQVLTYDLTTGVWGSVASLPVAVTSGGMVCINNQLIYYGGINFGSTADQSATWSLDLTNANAVWTADARMPDARNHIAYAAINGIAYAVGGEHLYNQTTGNDAEVDAYNPATNTWTTVASLPMPWAGTHGTTMVVNNKIVIIGGQTNGGYDGIYLNNIEEYDPIANTWINAGTIPEANQGEDVGYIGGELIVSGGTVDNLGGWATDQTWLDTEIVL